MIRRFGVGRGGGIKPQAKAEEDKTRQPRQLRLQKEIPELETPPGCEIRFPNKDDLSTFDILIKPGNGYYDKYKYTFSFSVPETYPYDPPKVKCSTPVFHPNIDFDGNICLNVLREDWKPVLQIDSVVFGLIHLMLEPTSIDPLNKEAAEVLKTNTSEFQRKVHHHASVHKQTKL
eukprot:Trichotokara_eunicae@DN6138_c0_g2_i1.p1